MLLPYDTPAVFPTTVFMTHFQWIPLTEWHTLKMGIMVALLTGSTLAVPRPEMLYLTWPQVLLSYFSFRILLKRYLLTELSHRCIQITPSTSHRRLSILLS